MASSLSLLPRPDTEFFPFPYQMANAQMLAFVLKAPDAATLAQNFIDPVLNAAAGSPGRFMPELGGHFVLGHIHYPQLAHNGADFGTFSYTESVIYLPIRDTHLALGEPFSYWFTPVMLLDSFLPLIAGREIFGFPKVLGRISTIPLPMEQLFIDATPNGSATVDAQGFATKRKTETCDWQRLWSLRITGEVDSVFENVAGHAVDNLLNIHLPRPLNVIDEVWTTLLRLMGPLNPGIFLKQFPSVADTALADYRRLMRCPFEPTAIHRVRMLGGEVTFSNPASFPIAEKLGFKPGATIPAELAFLVEMDWSIPPGEELPGQTTQAFASSGTSLWDRIKGCFTGCRAIFRR